MVDGAAESMPSWRQAGTLASDGEAAPPHGLLARARSAFRAARSGSRAVFAVFRVGYIRTGELDRSGPVARPLRPTGAAPKEGTFLLRLTWRGEIPAGLPLGLFARCLLGHDGGASLITSAHLSPPGSSAAKVMKSPESEAGERRISGVP